MKKLYKNFIISTILTERDPVTAAQGVNVLTNIFNGKFTVWIEGDFCMNRKGFLSSLVLEFRIIFLLNVGNKRPSNCVYDAIAALSGINMRLKVLFGNNSKGLCLMTPMT